MNSFDFEYKMMEWH